MQRKIPLLIAGILPVLFAFAQSPGGYSTGLSLWIKADAASTIGSTGGLIDSWTYFNNNLQVFTATGTDRPTLTANSINFLPSATFSGAQLMIGPDGSNTGAPLVAGDSDYCLFAVWRSSNNAAFQRVWSQRHLGGADDASGFALASWNNSTYGDQLEKSPYNQAMFLSYNANTWNITQLNVLGQVNNPVNDIEGRDQSNATGTPMLASSNGTRVLVDATNRLGARDNPTEEALTGDIAEVIIYSNPITDPTVRNQVFSYLAFKYGIHKVGDYVASNGAIYWNATANATYDNDVFGIGLDNGSGLSISQSNSINTGGGNGTGQNALGNIVISNPSSLTTNMSYLMIGHDGGALTETTSNLPPFAAGSERLARQWKVQHLGNVGTVNLDIDLTGLTISGNPAVPSDFRLLIDPDGDGDFTNNIDFTSSSAVYIKPTGFTGSVAHFTGIQLLDGVVFTVITSASTSLPVAWKSFTAKAEGNDVLLNWAVENNEQAKTYTVEHSTNGLDFAAIGTVANNVQVQSYGFTHNNVAGGKHYYRINEADADGKSIYSNVAVVLIRQAPVNIRLLSNPVRSTAELEINTTAVANANIELLSLSGAHIFTQQQGLGAGTTTLNIAMGNLVKGNYLLKVTVNDTVQLLQVSKL